MKRNLLKGIIVAGICAVLPLGNTIAQSFSESFNDITTLAGNGWVMTNASVAVGSTSWFQGNATSAGGPFDAYNGAANAYIGANYNNTGNVGTISNWLMTPNRTFRNGDVLTFYTRKPSPDTYADRLEVRLSTNGASTSVGTGSGVGDYTTLLLSINPNLTLGVYPTTWTMYTVTISGLPAPTSGRLAFRYFVTSAGLSGTNSDYIGIDQVDYTPYVCPSFTMTPSGALTGGAAGSAYSTSLTQTGALGTPNYAVTAGALPPGLTLSASGTISGTPTATGTFNFTVTVSDNSGCSGSSAYSITTVCGPNPTSLNGLPALCSNTTPYVLVEGSPAGGSYSGTGVSMGTFAPSAGTQTITYDYTDPYGCAYSSNAVITVNTAPTVTLDPFSAVCDNDGMIVLGGESPSGGSFSGTNVSGGMFDPAGGTQTITYTYTDANGCFGSATQSMTVNTAPTVSLNAFTAVCSNGGVVTLGGESPSGGTFSGTGVSGGMFDPASGTQTITYDYTDGNGCSGSASQTFNVNTAPTVTLNSFTAVCSNAAPVTLGGESPSGGNFTGVNVAGGVFDPSAGTQTITYDYTDGNGCSGSASQTFDVNMAPNVTLALTTTDVCIYNSPVTLDGGSPAGGTYSGTGVSGGSFDPATAGLGSASITYNYMDGNGCEADATDFITVDDCAGINEVNAVVVEVAPNPSTGNFMVSVKDASLLNNITVVDLNGRTVQNNIEVVNATSVSVTITEKSTGVYLLTGEYNGQPFSIRLVKQ